METTSAEAIRAYATRQYIEPARRTGAKRVRITAGEVHRGLRLRNRVPNVCSALGSKTFLQANGLAIEEVSGPPSGMGTRVTYTYRFLEPTGQSGQADTAPEFAKLRGLLKQALHSLGGGEAFLRRERERFHQHDRTDRK